MSLEPRVLQNDWLVISCFSDKNIQSLNTSSPSPTIDYHQQKKKQCLQALTHGLQHNHIAQPIIQPSCLCKASPKYNSHLPQPANPYKYPNLSECKGPMTCERIVHPLRLVSDFKWATICRPISPVKSKFWAPFLGLERPIHGPIDSNNSLSEKPPKWPNQLTIIRFSFPKRLNF